MLACAIATFCLGCRKQETTSAMSSELTQVTNAVFKAKPVKLSKEKAQELEKIFNENRKAKAKSNPLKVHSIGVKTNDDYELPSFGFTSFDFINNGYSLSTYDDVNQTFVTTYFVNQTGYDVVNNSVNYTVFFVPSTNSGPVPIMLQTQSTSLDTYTTYFYDMDHTYIMQLDVTDGSLSGVTLGSIPVTNGWRRFFEGWGNCLIDVYNNHGGASALAIVASTIYPPTTGYFALRCAAVNVHLL